MKRPAIFAALATAAIAMGVQEFRSMSARVLNTGGLGVSFSQTRLTPGVQSYTVRANADALFGCVNRGSRVVRGKTSTVNEMVSTVREITSRDGNMRRTLGLAVPKSGLECPAKQTARLVRITWTEVSLKNNTNNTTATVPGTFARTFLKAR